MQTKREEEMQQFIGAHAFPECKYSRPAYLEQALDLLNTDGEDSKVVAGCTDFIPAVRKGIWQFEPGIKLVDINSVQELQKIEIRENDLVLGAAVKLSDLVNSHKVQEYAAILSQAAEEMGSLQVRNSGTIGGNLSTASPAADTAPPLLALSAKIRIQGRHTDKFLSLEEFFTAPGCTLLQPGELLTEIHIPLRANLGRMERCKLGLRNAFTISIISQAVWIEIEDTQVKRARIALGAVAPTCMRAEQAENFLTGKEISPSSAGKCAEIVSREVKPITDLRASESYRRKMAAVLTRRLLLRCAQSSHANN